MTGLRSDGYADANFKGAASHHLGECGVKADGGEKKGDDGERGKELCFEAGVVGGKSDAVVQRADVEEGNVRVELCEFGVNCGDEGVGITSNAEDDPLRSVGGLFEWQIKSGARVLREICAANGADDTDNLKPGMIGIVFH